MKKILALTLAAVIASPANADTVKAATARLAACVQARDVSACRENLTAGSVELYDRFTGYDLMDCLPEEARYRSHVAEGEDTALVRAYVTSGGKKNGVRLVMQQEEDKWKLDIPESLHRGLGEKWEDQLNATEQVYLLLRSQLGDRLNCASIRGLAAGMSGEQKTN
ncbi:MAG: hypothetical protein K2Q01_04470 [Rickettsiales bacterium]|nr:hypothetical protein [Rickettsiales bacterium]